MESLAILIFLLYPIKWWLPEILSILFVVLPFFLTRLSTKKKFSLSVILPILTMAVFRGDKVVINHRFETFCASDYEFVKIHRVVELDPSSWYVDGWPKFHDRKTHAFLSSAFDEERYELDVEKVAKKTNHSRLISAFYVKDTVAKDYLVTAEKYGMRSGWWDELNDRDVHQYMKWCGATNMTFSTKVKGNDHPLSSLVFVAKNME